jgi:UDP-N-acetylmuramate dehydrogenase
MEWKGIRGRILERAPMKRYTSMNVGGPVRWLVYPADTADAVAVTVFLRRKGLPFRFLGNGTNVIVRDEGLEETVVRMTDVKQLRFTRRPVGAFVEAGAGVGLKTLIKETAIRGLSGLEKLFGIPGTVGGAVRMNAGSFGVSLSDSLTSVAFVDAKGKTKSRDKNDIAFSYRRSPFGPADCILGAGFRLIDRKPEEIRSDMNYVWAERCRRHPMEMRSAGSFFKNSEGRPAWKYIEQAGLKGMRSGNAAVSEKHANFIVNLGHATAGDVYRLVGKVKSEVLQKTGVMLEEEVELWGFDG